MKEMKIHVKFSCILCFVTIFCSMLATANDGDVLDCIRLNKDTAQIFSLKSQGVYRNENKREVIEFDYASTPSFQHYLDYAEQRIKALNPKAQLPCPISTASSKLYLSNTPKQRVVSDLIKPFVLQPENATTVVVLLHGLTDSPFVFHDIAAQFYQRGVAVRTLLLPGHGTAPSALVDIDEKQWRMAAKYAIERAQKDYSRVYLGGFSAGAALIIDQLLTKQSQALDLTSIKGLFLWSPASRAKSENAWLAKYVNYLPFFDYLSTGADIDIAKYESFAVNAGAQVHQLMTRIEPTNDRFNDLPDIPIFTVASDVDTTISTTATLSLLSRWHNADNRQSAPKDQLMYFGDDALLSHLPKDYRVIKAVCRDHQYCNQVIDVSHLSATNSANNPYYGSNGIYRNCEHISDEQNYQQCKQGADNYLGETIAKNIERYPSMQRLTFNPQFAQMIALMDQFLLNTGQVIKSSKTN